MVWVLIDAGVISGLLGECIDSAAIIAIVIINAVTVTINALLLNRVRFATDRQPVASSISQRGQE